jgi:hypothetical protein
MNESANNLNMWLNIKPTPKPSDFDPENGFESTFGKFEMEKVAFWVCFIMDGLKEIMDCFTLRMNSLKD